MFTSLPNTISRALQGLCMWKCVHHIVCSLLIAMWNTKYNQASAASGPATTKVPSVA
jgi:hypothetical protein